MPTHIAKFIKQIEKTRRSLNFLGRTEVSSVKIRASLQALAERYLSDIQPILVDRPEDQSHVTAVNFEMSRILELCEGTTAASTYSELLSKAKDHLTSLNEELSGAAHSPSPEEQLDAQIIAKLRILVPEAAAAYEQALLDLKSTNRLTWRGPILDLHVALRETLNYFASSQPADSLAHPNEVHPNTPVTAQQILHISTRPGIPASKAEAIERATTIADKAYLDITAAPQRTSAASTPGMSEALALLKAIRFAIRELVEIH